MEEKILAIEKLIKDNPTNWKQILIDLKINIVENENYYLFKYSLINNPDFTNEAVRQCRGIIFDKNTLKPVCIPFFKFGNYLENYVPDMDWKSVRIEEKIDGSLIKVWYHNGWHISTNGSIDAFSTDLMVNNLLIKDCPYKNFGDLFESVINLKNYNLNKNYTYMFELVSPYNQVVIKYDKTEVYHIGTRNNLTYQEIIEDIGVKKPNIYEIAKDLKTITEQANMFKCEKEGFVVVDKYWNRVKIKSEDYVKSHYIKNNGNISKNRLIKLILENETEEFLNYCPEFKQPIEDISSSLNKIFKKMEFEKTRMLNKGLSRKDLALILSVNNTDPFIIPFIFENIKQSISAKEYINKKPIQYVVNLLEKFGRDYDNNK